LIERLSKQEQAREMRTFDKTDIPHDKPQKETARDDKAISFFPTFML